MLKDKIVIDYYITREGKKIVVYEHGSAPVRMGDFDNRYEFYNLLAARNFIKKSVDVTVEKFGKNVLIRRTEDPNL